MSIITHSLTLTRPLKPTFAPEHPGRSHILLNTAANTCCRVHTLAANVRGLRGGQAARPHDGWREISEGLSEDRWSGRVQLRRNDLYPHKHTHFFEACTRRRAPVCVKHKCMLLQQNFTWHGHLTVKAIDTFVCGAA